MSFSVGIVGLPNVGKSTLFKALTKKQVDASNYPFCTIDPNVGVVAVPDERVSILAELSHSKKIIPTTIEFVDIAGLVKGASQGEGLGNKFLQNIREVDAIAQVIRMFKNPDVTHVHGALDPENDKEVINLELIMADLELAEKRLAAATSAMKGKADKKMIAEHAALEKIVAHLKDSQLLRTLELSEDESEALRQYNFLTTKPIIYIYNVSEEDITNPGAPEGSVPISARIESEIAELPEEDIPTYLEQLGLKETGLNRLITACYEALDLVTFLTTGPEETRAWTVPNGSTAPEAAGVIHSDLQDGFIRADVINWKVLADSKSWTAAKESGKVKTEGKGYVVRDGDVLIVHHN